MANGFYFDPEWEDKENFEFLKNRAIPKGAELKGKYIDRQVAVYNFPTLEVVLEAWRENGDEINDTASESEGITFNYFIVLKGKPTENCISFAEKDGLMWESDNYSDRSVNIDFSKDSWRQDLEKEMYDTGIEYAKENGYTTDKPNF